VKGLQFCRHWGQRWSVGTMCVSLCGACHHRQVMAVYRYIASQWLRPHVHFVLAVAKQAHHQQQPLSYPARSVAARLWTAWWALASRLPCSVGYAHADTGLEAAALPSPGWCGLHPYSSRVTRPVCRRKGGGPCCCHWQQLVAGGCRGCTLLEPAVLRVSAGCGWGAQGIIMMLCCTESGGKGVVDIPPGLQ
jgi:hypothetical protein